MEIKLNDVNTNARHAENAVIDDMSVMLDNGIEFSVKASNPHGFYGISLKKGKLPDELTGKYTGADLAIAHAKEILSRKAA